MKNPQISYIRVKGKIGKTSKTNGREGQEGTLTSGYSWNQPLDLRTSGTQLLFLSSSYSFFFSLYLSTLSLSFFNSLSNSPFLHLLKESVCGLSAP